MTVFITQCPHCGTSFRTRINQLQSADGMVRCGACLEVFVADDNLVPSAELQTVTLPVKEDTFSLFDEESDVSEPTTLDLQNSIDDDILTLDLSDSIPGRITPSISEQPVWEILGEMPPPDEAINADIDADTALDAHIRAPEKPAHQQPEAKPDPELFALHASIEEDAGADHYRFGSDHLATMGQADEILELDWQQPPQHRPVLWPYAALLVIALLGQFVVYEFDTLSENTRTRPWLQSACDALGCQLPQIVDVTAIRSDELLIRSHPQFSNALSIHMTVRNSGSPQPFPALNLKFSNVRNEVVAMRDFTPAEYLPEGLSANTPMPVNTPVQISLDILDPGIEAVNYEVSFSANPLR